MNNEKPDNRLLIDIIERRLAEQFSSVDTFATRAGLVLATCGVAFAGFAQLLTNSSWNQSCSSILFLPEMIFLVTSGYFAFRAMSVGSTQMRWAYDPDPEKLYRMATEKSREQLEDEAVRSMVEAYNANKVVTDRKYELLRYAQIALYSAGLVFIVHLVIFLT